MKFRTILAAAAAMMAVTQAQAQTKYPERAVTIIVPFTAGGATDVSARTLADGLSKLWGQPVNVENMPGGGTMIGIAAVKAAKPDGYTLGVFTNSFTVNPGVRSKIPYDTLNDFKGVSLTAETPTAIAAIASFPANNFKELIELAKKSGDKPITYGTPGLATGGHLSMELIQRETGTKFQHLPYNGTQQAIPDALAGRISLISSTWTDLKAQVEAGTMKLIAATGGSRLADKPEVGTVGEVIPGFNATGFNGILVAKGVPDDIVKKVSADMKKVLTSPEFMARAKPLAMIPWATTPEETDKFIASEVAKWKGVAESAKIKLD